MAELIRPTKVQVITKEGECKLNITIDLNINLNRENLGFKSDEPVVEKEKEEETIWAIPDFKSQDKVKFGKKKE